MKRAARAAPAMFALATCIGCGGALAVEHDGAAGGGGAAAGVGAGGGAETGDAGGGGSGGTAGCGAGAGAGAGGGAGGGGGAGPALDVTAALDGQAYLMPCGTLGSFSVLTCMTRSRVACFDHNASLTQGCLLRDDTVTIGGDAGAIYDVTVRVRGVVEPRHYTGGTLGWAANGGDYGWYVGGEPVQAGTYGIYMLWVSAPVVMQTGALDGQYYFLNAINHPEAHFSYPIDYTVTLPIAAGAQVRFLADDFSCNMVRNCDASSVDGYAPTAQCNPITLADLPATSGITQPYPGQFIYLTVVSAVMR